MAMKAVPIFILIFFNAKEIWKEFLLCSWKTTRSLHIDYPMVYSIRDLIRSMFVVTFGSR